MDRAQIEAFLADLYERTPGKGLTPDQRRDQLMAFLAGGADAGGIGSGALKMAGAPGAAKALTDAKAGGEGAAGLGEAANPLSIIPLLGGALGDLFTDDVAAPELKTRDRFFQERRKPVQSVGEVKAAARERAMNSDAYKQAVEDGNTKRAERIAVAAERSAEDALKKDAAKAGADDTTIGTDYEAYLKDYDRDLEAYNGRSFADRNPGIAKALPVIGTALAGIATKGILGKVGRKTQSLADDVIKARDAGDPLALANARSAAEQYGSTVNLKKGLTYGTAATIPADLQLAADVIDAKGLDKEYQDSSGDWKPARAQQEAAKRVNVIEDPYGFAGRNAVSLISGGVGAMTGGKLAQPTVPVPRAVNQQDMTAAVDEILAGINAQKAVQAARQPASPPPNNTPVAPVAPPVPPAQPPGPPVQTATTPSPQSRAPRQPSKGPTYTSGSPDQMNVQRIIDDLLTDGQSVTNPQSLAVAVRSAGGAPKMRDAQLLNRATGSAREARSLQELGVDLNDPKIRRAILDKIAPGTAGMLSVGGLANGDIEALLAEIMGGGG
jgi:hypothetical protein